MSSCEFYEISKNNFFTENFWVTASVFSENQLAALLVRFLEITHKRVHFNNVVALQKQNYILEVFQRFLKKLIQEHFSVFTINDWFTLICLFWVDFLFVCFAQNIIFITFEETKAQVWFQQNERKIMTVWNNYEWAVEIVKKTIYK